MNDNLEQLAHKLLSCYEEAYNIYSIEVNRIITNKITDNNYIELTLDYILSIYTEKGFYLFIKLLLYYQTINEDKARYYLNLLQEDREEEYHDFVKKLRR